jgi:SAM-dependent methyltransferase
VDATAWDERYAAAEQVWSTEPNQFVASELADLPPGDAVDLACGEGRNAIWLARRGWRVTALDFSEVAVDRGRRLAGDLEVAWVVGDALTAELPAADLVLLAYLQLPAAQRRAAVRRGFAALRPGGTLFVVAHDATNLAEGTGGPQDPAVLYTAEDVLADLDGEPVRVERAERVGRVVRAPAGTDEHGGQQDRTAWDALVRLRRRG